MNKVCFGCGALMQSVDSKRLGYVNESKMDEAQYCERCFKIIHYNDKSVVKLNNVNSYVIETTNNLADYVYFLIDFLNLNKETLDIFKAIKKPKTLIISKSDIIPKSIKENVIISWLKKVYQIDSRIIFQSTKKNISTKSLLDFLKDNDYKVCYFLGFTNAGKSTLVNKLCQKNNKDVKKIATSYIPNTTIDFIEIELENGLKIIDSPGFVLSSTFYKDDEFLLMDSVNPKNVLKPRTYQVKEISSILIEDKIRLKTNVKNSLTFYMSNNVLIERVFSNNTKLLDKEKIILDIPSNSDLVIYSLGFINIKKSCKLKIYTDIKDLIEVRDSMFGTL